MAIRPVYDNSVAALQSLVRDLNAELERIRSGDNQGKRAANAAPAVQPADLVTKGQLDVVVDRLRKVENQPRQTRGFRAGTGTTPTGDGLPKATHYMDFWYYQGKTYYQEYRTWVNCCYAGAGEDDYEADPSEWIPVMAERMRTAVQDGKTLTLEWDHGSDNLNLENTLLACEMAGFDLIWPKINLMLLTDEPGGSTTRAEFEEWIADTRDQIRAYNLPVPPIGAAFTKYGIRRGDLINANGLDVVGVEGYIDPPGDPNSAVNVNALNAWIDEAKSIIPANKKLFFIIQAYNRNGAWPNETTLLALQTPMYLKAWNDPRVVSIGMFTWDRPGNPPGVPAPSKGTRQLGATFQNEHKRIYAALMGSTQPSDGCKKLTTGANLQQYWFDGFDLTIIENPALFYNPGDGTYVVAGSEAAARDALIATLNRDQYPVTAIAGTPIPPYGPYDVLMKPEGSTEYSELFTPFASSGKCRLAGGYIETCRPSVF